MKILVSTKSFSRYCPWRDDSIFIITALRSRKHGQTISEEERDKEMEK
jgi:hypothetical protein